MKTVEVQASLLKRGIAFVIDLLILNIFILWPFNKFAPKASIADLRSLVQSAGLIKEMYIMAFFTSIVVIAYFSYFEYRFGQTPGKMLFKLKLKESKSKPLSLIHYILSNIFLVQVFPFIILWFTELGYLLFSKTNQRWLEKIFKLELVEVSGYG